MTQAVRYSEALTVQVQPGFRSLIDTAAARVGTKPTEWARQALTEALRAAGFDPVASLAPQQYCLVRDGELIATSFNPSKDEEGGEWLPIDNEDNQPFDPALHWRLKPLPLRLDGDRVVRVYPVVPKSILNKLLRVI